MTEAAAPAVAPITAQVEPYSAALINEARALLTAHWEELALDRDKVPLAPWYEVYEARARQNEVLVVTLRSAGACIGYFVGFIVPGLHYRTCLSLTMDVFFISPTHRNRSAGALKLFRTAEAEAKKRGVERIYLGTKLSHDTGRLFRALGYRPSDMYYSKWVGA